MTPVSLFLNLAPSQTRTVMHLSTYNPLTLLAELVKSVPKRVEGFVHSDHHDAVKVTMKISSLMKSRTIGFEPCTWEYGHSVCIQHRNNR
jgi:hypothetical protein